MLEKTIGPDIWRERIVAQQVSGLSVGDWCRGNGFAEHVFYYWRRKLGLGPAKRRRMGRRNFEDGRDREVRRSMRRTVEPLGFAEVIATSQTVASRTAASQTVKFPVAEPSTASVILLRLGGQRELVLPMAMDVELIAKLVAAIERSA